MLAPNAGNANFDTRLKYFQQLIKNHTPEIKNDIKLMRSFNNPPNTIKVIMQILLALLGI